MMMSSRVSEADENPESTCSESGSCADPLEPIRLSLLIFFNLSMAVLLMKSLCRFSSTICASRPRCVSRVNPRLIVVGRLWEMPVIKRISCCLVSSSLLCPFSLEA